MNLQTTLPDAAGQPEALRAAEPPPVVAAFRNVCKYFDSFWGGNLVRALADVTVEIRHGEIFGLVGPADSGKSTFLKLLAGRLLPMEGRVRVFERSPRRRSVAARIGYMAQQPVRTGDRAQSAAPSRDIRSALAQALHGNPDILVLDDPLAGLDPGLDGELRAFIRSFARSGKTVVLASRSLCDVQAGCDRMAIFSGGRIEAVGAMSELLGAREAVRFLAPVLPASLLDRLRETIRGELMTGEESPVACQESADDCGVSPAQGRPRAADHSTAAADQILARLLKSAATERFPTEADGGTLPENDVRADSASTNG